MADTPPDELAVKRAKRKPRSKPGTKPGRKAGSTPGPLSGTKEIDARRKSAQAVQLRLAGASLVQVADRLGYADASGAQRAIMREIREMIPDEDRADLRRLEVARLDRLEMNAWPRAMAGDEKAEATILRCIGMRAKLLGLEAAVQLDVALREGDPVRVEILDVLNDETLASLKPLQERMIELTEMRANAIDVTPS